MSETVDKKNLLTSKEVNRAWLLWLFNNQACYNYERMMGIGFLHARSEERRVGKECRSRWSPYH